MIFSGSFPTEFAGILHVQVLFQYPKLPTWLTYSCVNILYQPATPVTTQELICSF